MKEFTQWLKKHKKDVVQTEEKPFALLTSNRRYEGKDYPSPQLPSKKAEWLPKKESDKHQL